MDAAKDPFDSTRVAVRNAQAMQIRSSGETASTAVAAQATAMTNARYEMAIRYPRNMDTFRQDLMNECRRPSFAHNKSALYNKPIGKGVEGLGIRFVEVALRCMRNTMAESIMVYSDNEKEIQRVVVTDLESNTTYPVDIVISKTVERSKPMDDGTYISVRKNSYNKDVFTVPANDDDLLNKRGALISKALRTAALRIIPGDLQDEAEALIRKIRLDKAAEDPDLERRTIIDAFGKLNIKAADLNEYLGHDLGTCTPAELVDLRGLYGALRDGDATWATVMENKRQLEGNTAGDPSKTSKTGVGAMKEKLKGGDKGAKDSGAGDATGKGAPASDASTGDKAEVTVLSAMAKLDDFNDIGKMGEYTDALPNEIKTDDRFTNKFRERMTDIKTPSKK